MKPVKNAARPAIAPKRDWYARDRAEVGAGLGRERPPVWSGGPSRPCYPRGRRHNWRDRRPGEMANLGSWFERRRAGLISTLVTSWLVFLAGCSTDARGTIGAPSSASGSDGSGATAAPAVGVGATTARPSETTPSPSPPPTTPPASPTTTVTVATTPATSAVPSAGAATLELTSVPARGSFDDLVGRVINVEPSSHRVATYIRVQGAWWTKPYWVTPTAPIDFDGVFRVDISTGGTDEQADLIRVYIVKASYSPPLAKGEGSAPPLDSSAVTVSREVRR